MIRVMIADDQELIRESLQIVLDINEDMQTAASLAIASLVSDEELNEDYIMPFAFDERIGKTVAEKVAEAAIASGVARIKK